MHQMLQYFDRLMPQGEIDSQSPFPGHTQEYIHKIGEKIRSRVVFVTMLPQIMSTIYLLVWRSSDIVSERYMTYSAAISVIFIVHIYKLYTFHVSSQSCAKLLSINFLITHILTLIDLREKGTLPLTVSNGRLSFLFWIPPFSYVFAGKKFGIMTATITCIIYFYEIFWPSAGTSLVRGIFYLVLDLVMPILMFTLLSTFAFIDKHAEEVKEANRSRSVFLQTISHELRTPIHGILASTEIFLSSPLTSAQRALISAIQNSGINVIHMADHILRVAKSDDLNVMKGIIHETRPFDLYKATEQITDGIELLFETEDITFEFEYRIPLQQSMFIGDVGVIKQIIINLLGTVLSIGRLARVTFNVDSRLKVPTEKIFTVEFDIMAEYKFLDQGEGSTQRTSSTEYLSKLAPQLCFIQTLVDALGGSFTFNGSDDFRTPFVIQLDLPLAEDTNPNMNTKPIPLRYFIKEFEDIDPRNLLRIGMVRAHDSIVTRKALAFLHEFEMQSLKIITPNDIPSCDINVLIFDSTETTNEINETICKNAREAHVLIISITFLLKHLTICDTAQKVGLGDGKVYFVAKPLTNVKFWNVLLSVADVIKKRTRNIESATDSEQDYQASGSHQGETSGTSAVVRN